MIYKNIAMALIQKYYFDENPTWQHNKQIRRILMDNPNKIWIILTIYIIYLWTIWFTIIMKLS